MTSPIGAVQCVQIGIEDDTVIEDDEQFEISLVLPDSDDDDGGSLLAVTIEDNDGKNTTSQALIRRHLVSHEVKHFYLVRE